MSSPGYVHLVAILCVVGIAAGQILFKLSASYSLNTGSPVNWRSLTVLACALAIYGLATIAWVWVLRFIELGRAYPLMALAFVLVPIGSYFAFGERFQLQYYIGTTLIVLGVAIVARS